MLRVGCTEAGREAVPRQMAVRQRVFGSLLLNPAYGSSLFLSKIEFSEGASERRGQNAC